jgi:hypothetical protein
MVIQKHFGPEGPFKNYLSRNSIDENWFYNKPVPSDDHLLAIITCVKSVLKDAAVRNNRCSEAEWGRLIVSPILRLMSEVDPRTENMEVLVADAQVC